MISYLHFILQCFALQLLCVRILLHFCPYELVLFIFWSHLIEVDLATDLSRSCCHRLAQGLMTTANVTYNCDKKTQTLVGGYLANSRLQNFCKAKCRTRATFSLSANVWIGSGILAKQSLLQKCLGLRQAPRSPARHDFDAGRMPKGILKLYETLEWAQDSQDLNSSSPLAFDPIPDCITANLQLIREKHGKNIWRSGSFKVWPWFSSTSYEAPSCSESVSGPRRE